MTKLGRRTSLGNYWEHTRMEIDGIVTVHWTEKWTKNIWSATTVYMAFTKWRINKIGVILIVISLKSRKKIEPDIKLHTNNIRIFIIVFYLMFKLIVYLFWVGGCKGLDHYKYSTQLVWIPVSVWQRAKKIAHHCLMVEYWVPYYLPHGRCS